MVVCWHVCATLHQVRSSLGVFLCHFALGMVACLRFFACAILHRLVWLFHFATNTVAYVCAILQWKWSSVGLCLCHFAQGMVVSWRVCATLHQVWSSVAFFCHFASGVAIPWRVCASLHEVYSSVGLFVSLRIKVCLLVGVSLSFYINFVGFLCHRCYGWEMAWFVPFCMRYCPQLACVGANAILHQIWSLPWVCLCHFE